MPSDADLIEVGMAIATSMRLAMVITVEDAERYAAAAVSEQSRTHALGPITNPTEYRRLGPRADASANMARSFLDFRRAIEANRAPAHLRGEL